MTYKEQYQSHKAWQDRAVIMGLFHAIQVAAHKQRPWRITDTAKYFGVSIGLVSENLKIAHELDKCKHLKSRAEAVDFLRAL